MHLWRRHIVKSPGPSQHGAAGAVCVRADAHLQAGELGFACAEIDAQRFRTRFRGRRLLPDRCQLLVNRLRTHRHGGSCLRGRVSRAHEFWQQRWTCKYLPLVKSEASRRRRRSTPIRRSKPAQQLGSIVWL